MSKVYIRSQDRAKLYCFGNSLNVLGYSKNTIHRRGIDTVRHTICISDGCLEEIGEYESKERCLEILDEMQAAFSSYYKSTCGLNIPDMMFDMPTLYEMPEK